MTTAARLSRSSSFSLKRAADANYIIVGDLTTISVPEADTEEIDVSTLDSAGFNKEYISGATDFGEISVQGYFVNDDAGQVAAYAAFGTKENFSFKISLPKKGDETEAAFYQGTGFFKNVSPAGEIAEGSVIPFTATIRVSGALTFTAATAS
jgi:predicted secreted protein